MWLIIGTVFGKHAGNVQHSGVRVAQKRQNGEAQNILFETDPNRRTCAVRPRSLLPGPLLAES